MTLMMMTFEAVQKLWLSTGRALGPEKDLVFGKVFFFFVCVFLGWPRVF